ncbi:MAG TPA: radical SAM protein, partial [Candidatus Hydrogenedentes bacterium]|nr:radical SAM protein [Candidatus Hydrogenedentota bacterium]
VIPKGLKNPCSLQLVQDLDEVPFPDRHIFYRVMPLAVQTGLRSFMTSRGCPYQCTYCFNHAYNKLFAGQGTILRRRSVENVIEEIKKTQRDFPGARFIRFADDTFCHRADPWLEKFAEYYRREIGIPFYCLMRSNTLTDETAKLLSEAGCVSIGMSIEAGNEEIRNRILKRNITDELLIESFEIARKYGIRTYASTMVGIPGTSIDSDYYSLDFVRRVSPSATIFNICTPFYGTRLWDYCLENQFINPMNVPTTHISQTPPLDCFTSPEKQRHWKMSLLGPLYCHLPGPLHKIIRLMINVNIPVLNPFYYVLGRAYTAYRIATRIFRHSLPRNPLQAFRLLLFAVRRMT